MQAFEYKSRACTRYGKRAWRTHSALVTYVVCMGCGAEKGSSRTSNQLYFNYAVSMIRGMEYITPSYPP